MATNSCKNELHIGIVLHFSHTVTCSMSL